MENFYQARSAFRFPKSKLGTKFEVPTSSSFEDMFDPMPKI